MSTFDYTPMFANASETPPLDQATAIIGNFILNHYDYLESILKPAINGRLVQTSSSQLIGDDAPKIRKIINRYIESKEESISSAPTRDEMIRRIRALESELHPFLYSQEQTLTAALHLNQTSTAPIHEHLFHNISYFLPETSTNRELLQEMMNSIYRILELTIEPTRNNVLRISIRDESFSLREQEKFTQIIDNYNKRAKTKPESKRPKPLEPQYKIEGHILTFEPSTKGASPKGAASKGTSPKGTASKGGKRKTHKRKTHRRKTQKRK
jgi:hypothetical protein